MMIWFYYKCLKMAQCNSHETHNIFPNLSATPSNEQKFTLNKINEIKDYFVAKIKERELMSKRLSSKYIASFDNDMTMVKQWYYQNVQYVVVKNPNLLKSKNQRDYWVF